MNEYKGTGVEKDDTEIEIGPEEGTQTLVITKTEE